MSERPQAQPFFGQLPQPRQAQRLDDQEQDDHLAEDHLLQRRRNAGIDGLAEQGVEHNVQKDRHQQHESSASKLEYELDLEEAALRNFV